MQRLEKVLTMQSFLLQRNAHGSGAGLNTASVGAIAEEQVISGNWFRSGMIKRESRIESMEGNSDGGLCGLYRL